MELELTKRRREIFFQRRHTLAASAPGQPVVPRADAPEKATSPEPRKKARLGLVAWNGTLTAPA